ncbi:MULTISPECIES: sensor histidine kinase [Clostridium]|uniref:sensor histidine kinase n=1 Tax=Clostridium TaxID=1485 RepID=UPI0008249382|nr:MULTISPECIES: HAMP domain-containing sensor histidine kinase [Clostridium]PJI10492.1 sensor histidine kinase [Clostridium sp. CT7]
MLLKKIKYITNKLKNTKISISIKITAVYAILFSLVLLILNASILFGVKHYLYSEASKQIEDVQVILVNKAKSWDLSSKTFFSDIPSTENMEARVIERNGKVLNSSEKFEYKIMKWLRHHKIAADREKRIEDDEKHLIYKKVTAQSKKNGTIYIEIIKNMNNEYWFMKVLFGFMAAADFIGIIASILLGYIVSKRMLKPIDYITKTAENISISNLNDRLQVKGPDDELKRLASTFNKMIERLQEAFDRQTQFVSDASHELRTPIAVIQGYANLLDRWGKDDREALEKSISAIKLEASSMGDLIEKLLFLARGDNDTQLIEKKEFYLNELIDEIVRESKIIEKNRTIESCRNDDVMIFADYKMIKEMIRIFIDNSIKFTPGGGKIDVSSMVYNDTVQIIVSDNGIGIPKDEAQKIFNRFYVVDKSRSKEKGGSGLGLSIAKWIANMHGGAIDVKSKEGKGTKIIVTLKLD